MRRRSGRVTLQGKAGAGTGEGGAGRGGAQCRQGHESARIALSTSLQSNGGRTRARKQLPRRTPLAAAQPLPHLGWGAGLVGGHCSCLGVGSLGGRGLLRAGSQGVGGRVGGRARQAGRCEAPGQNVEGRLLVCAIMSCPATQPRSCAAPHPHESPVLPPGGQRQLPTCTRRTWTSGWAPGARPMWPVAPIPERIPVSLPPLVEAP